MTAESHSLTHAMIKIRRPDLDPFRNKDRDPINNSNYYSMQQSQFPNEQIKPQNHMIHDSIASSSMMQSSVEFSSMQRKDGGRQSINKKIFKARFVKESFAENYTVEQGKKFEKVWTFRNEGPEAWPVDTRFIYTNGDQIGQLEKKIDNEIQAGQYVDITVEFQAPAKTGKYCAFYRFVHGKNERFG